MFPVIKRKIALILILTVLSVIAPAWGNPSAAAGTGSVAVIFEKDGIIYLTDTGGTKAKALVKGYDPQISPDGTSVAYTAAAGRDGFGRVIAVYSIASKKNMIFRSIPGQNSYGPKWSPDGRMLGFNHFDEQHSDWISGLLTLKDGRFRAPAPGLRGVFSHFWSPDSRFIYCHDLENLYRISAETGKTEKTGKLSSVIGKAMASSAMTFAISPDGKRWLFDGEVEDTSSWMKSGDGLMSALFLHTPEDGKTRRITSDSINAMAPAWLPGGEEFLFSGCTAKEAAGKGYGLAVFRGSLKNKSVSIIVPEGGSPSAAIQ